MGIFGWSYPPGAANDPNAPWNQEEGPCAVCGNTIADCICPACKQCDELGDPNCYDKTHRLYHGMERSPEQIAALSKNEADWAETARQESEAMEAYAKGES